MPLHHCMYDHSEWHFFPQNNNSKKDTLLRTLGCILGIVLLLIPTWSM